MATYQIENTRSGVILGEYEASSEAEALNAMARDAGYADYAACCEVAPVSDGEIVVNIPADGAISQWPVVDREIMYRAAIYFAVATLHFYRDEILPLTPQQTLGDFADANRAIIDRVCAEAREYLDYDLSHEQIGRAIRAYTLPPCTLQKESEGTV